MQVGVRLPHTGPQASPDFIRDWCELADEAGFGSIWGVDHVVMPHHTDSRYILPRQPATLEDGAVSALLSPNFELMTTLAYVAAVTKRIRIGTAVAVLTIRNAVLNARQLATVDRYSGGRVLYGVGIGWLEEEADAMNMPWDHRGARATSTSSCSGRSGRLPARTWSSTGSTGIFHRWIRNHDPSNSRFRS